MIAGIDLGTTYSLVAKLNPDGRPLVIPDVGFREYSNTPSAIYLGGRSALVGRPAEALLEQNPQARIIRFFKRKLGEKAPVTYDPDGRPWYPEGLSALLLRKLKHDYVAYSGEDFSQLVLTVPAHFADHQRQAVVDAANLAGIPLAGLIDEPTAAALHYGITQADLERKVFLVYDFGGGTFDLTILTIDKEGVFVLAKDGIDQLGGKEFDEVIMSYIAEQFERQGPVEWNDYLLMQLRKVGEEVKIKLSEFGQSVFRKKILLGPYFAELTFRRADFEAGIRDHIARTIELCKRTILEAGLQPHDLDAALLVGGTSQIPAVREALIAHLGFNDNQVFSRDPMMAVAKGAAYYAAQLDGKAGQFAIPPIFRGVTAFQVGLKVVEAHSNATKIEPLISKNLPLPAKAKKTIFTQSVEQKFILIELVQYQSHPDDHRTIGTLMIGPVKHIVPVYAVELRVEVSQDGMVAVNAFDPQTGSELHRVYTNQTEVDAYLITQRRAVEDCLVNAMYS